MRLPELKPCPFCGYHASLLHTSSGYSNNRAYKVYKIWCPNCGVTGCTDIRVEYNYSPIAGASADEDALLKAIERWNIRNGGSQNSAAKDS